MVSTDSRGLRARLEAVTGAGAIGAVGHSRGATGRGWDGAAGVRTIDGAEPARAGDTARVASVTKAMVAGAGDTEEFLAAINRDRTDRQLVAAALSQPWLFEPGTDFSYSNTNCVVVGLMLGRATKRSMRSLLEQRVLSPARMTRARFPTTGPTFAGRRHITDYAIFERPYNLDGHSSTIFSSAGAVVASARDIASFYRALLPGTWSRRPRWTRCSSPAPLRSVTGWASTAPATRARGPTVSRSCSTATTERRSGR